MSKVPGKAGFVQPTHGKGGTSSAKNKGAVAFKQGSASAGKAGKTSSKKSPGKLGFTQKTTPNKGNSTAKNPGKVGFDQPNPAKKTVAMPVVGKMKSKVAPSGLDFKKPKSVSTPAGGFKSTDQLVAYRKGKYGA